MSSSHKNLSDPIGEIPSGEGLHIGIVVSEWNEDITFALRDGCIEELTKHHVASDHIAIEYVPGTFELPLGARLLAQTQKLDAIICIGCVIKGETKHDEYINSAVSNGIMQLTLASGRPVVFGVLTPNDKQQALDRAGGKYGNKGVEAAHTALKMAHLSKKCGTSKKSIGF